jgi:hypothetical protein
LLKKKKLGFKPTNANPQQMDLFQLPLMNRGMAAYVNRHSEVYLGPSAKDGIMG